MYIRKINNTGSLLGYQCGCIILVMIFNSLIGGWSVSYLVITLLDKTISFWGACLIGLFTAQFSVPAAIAIWLLRVFEVM